ncbi:MAG: NRDE family protein [Bacteroidia bacterium]
MCLNIFSYKAHPDYKLIIAANRDEFYARKTEAAHFWTDTPDLLAGKDLEQGGTWLGITKTGKFSFITNYRDPKSFRKDAPSRGALVSDYLNGSLGPEQYLKSLVDTQRYNGFNLVAGDLNEVCYFSNVENKIRKLDKGFYAVSNALLDTPWKKLVTGKNAVETVIGQQNFNAEELFSALHNEQKADDSELPQTGVPYEIEKLISSMFIKSDSYGTVCSTVVLMDNQNRVRFFERTHNPLKENKTVGFEFVIR